MFCINANLLLNIVKYVSIVLYKKKAVLNIFENGFLDSL